MMSTCTVCGNQYDKTFEVIKDGTSYLFDCLECAIQKLAPTCVQCGCRILGHGIEAGEQYYCCAHCARKAGIQGAKDHV